MGISWLPLALELENSDLFKLGLADSGGCIMFIWLSIRPEGGLGWLMPPW